jgi:hypothetical protein
MQLEPTIFAKSLLKNWIPALPTCLVVLFSSRVMKIMTAAHEKSWIQARIKA